MTPPSMRRSTSGVLDVRELLDARATLVDVYGPEDVVRVLEPLVGDARRSRLNAVIDARLASVAVVFDGPYDPHNGAAVIRSCEAFGVQRLHVVERPGTPFLAARSVARGAQKWIDLVCHEGADSLLSWSREERMPLVGAHPEGALSPEDLAAMPRLTVVLGNEREGIRPAIAEACAARVRVPMRGFSESLNVSVTAAILLQAATRGRSGDLDATSRRRLYARGLVFSVTRAPELLRLSLGEPDQG
jgi:tRNA (guanosine-2'-O-)-methyltransferase